MEDKLHITLAAEKIGNIFGLPVTNTLITTWLVIGLLIILGIVVRKKIALVPGKLQNALEMLIEYFFGLVKETLGSRQLAKRYFPLIATIFIFILALFYPDNKQCQLNLHYLCSQNLTLHCCDAKIVTYNYETAYYDNTFFRL